MQQMYLYAKYLARMLQEKMKDVRKKTHFSTVILMGNKSHKYLISKRHIYIRTFQNTNITLTMRYPFRKLWRTLFS